MSSKDEEKEILYSVYKKELIEDTLIDSETPDFILIDSSNKERIGVEITTLYTNLASGMSRNDKFLDSYIDEHTIHITKKKKKKPAFLKGLKVAPVEGDKGYVHKEHVVWKIATLPEFFSSFEKIIATKSNSYNNQIKDLQFVNLIAKDKERFFKYSENKVGILYKLLREHTIFSSILNSNFQEIFYVSDFLSGKYSVPLKWLIFQSEFLIF